MPWFSATTATAVTAAVVTTVVVSSTAATAADQQQDDDDNPGASTKTVIAHIVLPPFVYTTVYVRAKKVLQILFSKKLKKFDSVRKTKKTEACESYFKALN